MFQPQQKYNLRIFGPLQLLENHKRRNIFLSLIITCDVLKLLTYLCIL